MARNLQVLSPEDARHFIEKGYVRVKGCVDPTLAKRWTDEAYTRLGYDPIDRSTWTKDIVWMDRHNTAAIKDISPKGWAALCDVTGGADRIENKIMEIESQHFFRIFRNLNLFRGHRGHLPEVIDLARNYKRVLQFLLSMNLELISDVHELGAF